MRGIAPRAGADRERDLRREKIFAAEVKLGDVVDLVWIFEGLDDGDVRMKVVDQVLVRHVNRVEIHGKHGQRTNGNARAVNVRNVKRRVGELHEIEIV